MSWCKKHWKPYRDGKANGFYASLAIMQAFLDSTIFAELQDKSPASLNQALRGDKPLCCRLGEAVMSEILKKAKELKT